MATNPFQLPGPPPIDVPMYPGMQSNLDQTWMGWFTKMYKLVPGPGGGTTIIIENNTYALAPGTNFPNTPGYPGPARWYINDGGTGTNIGGLSWG